MKTAEQIASELTPHIAANNAAVGETNRRLARIGDGQGNPRPPTLLTPRDVYYRSDLDQNDRGIAILHPKCPITLQAIDGYYDEEVWIGNAPGSAQVYILDLADSGGFTTGGPTPAESLASSAAMPSQDRLLLMRLRPSSSGGLAVYVDVGIYAIAYEVGDGTYDFVASTDFNLPDPTDGVIYHPTAAALTSGQHRLVGVAFDPSSGTFIAIPGTAASVSGSLPSRSDFVEADYAAIDFTNYYPAGYLYSYFGQTTFAEDDCLRLFDPRLILRKMGLGGGNLQVTDGTTTVNPATKINFMSGATVTNAGGGEADVAVSGGGGGTGYILIQDQKTIGTDGGTFNSGAWQTRDLNTIVDDTTGAVTLSSNQFTLPAGTYRLIARCPAYAVDTHQCRLRNITDSTTVAIGSNVFARSNGPGSFDTWVQARFTIASPKTFEIQHQCGTSHSGNGYGIACGFGIEVYTSVELEKE